MGLAHCVTIEYNGGEYVGNLENDVPHGWGVLKKGGTWKYIGNWK